VLNLSSPEKEIEIPFKVYVFSGKLSTKLILYLMLFSNLMLELFLLLNLFEVQSISNILRKPTFNSIMIEILTSSLKKLKI